MADDERDFATKGRRTVAPPAKDSVMSLHHAKIRHGAFLMLVSLALAQLTITVGFDSSVSAGSGQAGAPMTVINPGGGVESDGSDGLKILVNSDGSVSDAGIAGQDQIFFANTVQYCCTAGAPMLNIGGTLFGQAGPAYSSANWTSITVGNVTGSTTTTTGVATGSGTATLHYTATKGGRTYTMARAISYTYPNTFFTDSYSFTIPAGNTDVVKFYQGGDTAPGSSDSGYGIMLTSPVRSVISLNTSSQIQFGFREVAGGLAFHGATSEDYYLPYSTVEAGGDIPFAVDASQHDAGLMVQWNLGSTPGTQTASMEEFVTRQEVSLSAQFRDSTFDYSVQEPFDFNLTNTLLTSSTGNGFTFTLPSGMTIGAGAQTNGCGGTLTSVSGSHTITLTAVTVLATSNCVLTIPVAVSAPGNYGIDATMVSGRAGALVNRVATSELSATSTTNSAPVWVDQTLGAMNTATYYNDGVVASGWPLPTFSISAGVLPAGLTLDSSNGSITGTPTTIGAFDFTITATNGVGSALVHQFTGSITGPPTAPAWTDSSLAAFQVGATYSDGVTATGSPAVTYSTSIGSLPAGILLNSSTGALTGSPTTAGSYSFTLAAGNGVGSPVTHAFTGTVAPPNSAPAWTDQLLGAMQVGVVFTDGVSTTGYPAPTYSVSAGALPAGLSLNSVTGAITGTPTTAAAINFTISAGNGVGSPVTHAFTGTVAPPNSAPAWVDQTVGAMQVGVAYIDGVSATGYPAPTYTVSVGALPPGLTLNSVTGAITGTPTTSAAISFTVTVSNGVGSPVTHAFSGTVAAAPAIELDLTLEVGAHVGTDGATLFVQGSGLQPGSTYVLEMHSAPVVLATGTVDSNGAFAQHVVIPADAPFGSHSLIITGIDNGGNPHTDLGWFSVTSTGAIGAVSESAPIPDASSDRGYVGLVPSRLLDTRDAIGAYAANSVHQLPVAGHFGVAADATAVVVNVAVDKATAPGFLTLYPCGTDRPLAANLNFVSGQTTSNAVTVSLGSGPVASSVCIYSSATTNVIIDVEGAFSRTTGTGLLAAIQPSRLLDTREVSGPTNGAKVVGGTVQHVLVAGRGGVPAGATSAVLNVAVDSPSTDGFITAYPCGVPTPLSSNVNFVAGEAVSNAVTTAIGSNGEVCFFTDTSTHLIVDVDGAFVPTATSGHLLPTTIARLLDTREMTGPTAGNRVATGSIQEIVVAGRGSVPANASAVTLNVGVDGPLAVGFLTVFPCGSPRPLASNVNFVGSQTISNQVTVGLGSGGKVCVFTMTAAHLIVDLDAVFGQDAV
jgi:Putative Ig domain